MRSKFPNNVSSTAMFVLCLFGLSLLSACGEPTEMGPKEKQAIQMVKSFIPEGGLFSVISNIEKRLQADAREGKDWVLEPWKAGLPDQKARIIDTLSQYFNIFRSDGDYWVRFTYKNESGSHEARWDVNVYTKKVTAKNDAAKTFEIPTDEPDEIYKEPYSR